jgi:hypothetical protein
VAATLAVLEGAGEITGDQVAAALEFRRESLAGLADGGTDGG